MIEREKLSTIYIGNEIIVQINPNFQRNFSFSRHVINAVL